MLIERFEFQDLGGEDFLHSLILCYLSVGWALILYSTNEPFCSIDHERGGQHHRKVCS